MKKSIVNIMDVITKINNSMMWVAGILITIATAFLFADVVLRYFFNSSTGYGFDIALICTGLIAFLLGGYGVVIKQHVRVDIFFDKFSLRIRSLIDLIYLLFLFLIAVAFLWLGTDYVLHYYSIGAQTSGALIIPLWTKWLMVPIGGLLLALQGIVKLINDVYIIVTGEVLYDSEEGL
ncbi:C4-dicarboxylate transporter DctQ subunit [Neobacillus niacini]|uniref:TRAP transporter small permease subunit n=1 Tax=Neobacillus niacini TaxID=86668 RepID=UPI00278A6117|nr:TRAP transporter small permease [Neobacillus niacini]MDQ1002182.1 C4-dicarboxylate transporter DctQ subunit [Neobacillus niacini]